MTVADVAVADLWLTGGARQMPGALVVLQRAVIMPLDGRRAWSRRGGVSARTG